MIPYAPTSQYRPNNRLSDLLLRSGESQAEGHRRSGQIWGGAVAGLGNIAANAVQDYSAQKQERAQAEEMSKRDAAFMGLLDASGGDPDPKDILRMFGPERGLKVAEGLAAFKSLGVKKGEAALADLPKLVGGMNAVGEKMRASLYPQAAAAIKQAGIFPEGAIPDQYDPEFWKEASAFVSGMSPQKPDEGFTLGEGQVRFGPDGKPIASGPITAPKPAQPRVVGRSLVDDSGKVIYRDPESGRTENKIWVRRPGPDGKLAPVFIPESEVRAGDTPTNERTEGRPATGVERKITSFFGRMKQADEDIERLEESLPTGLAGQTRMEFAPNFLQSDVGQAYRAAQNQFTEARLRKDSGAAVPPHEYVADRKAYFPQPGDTPDTIAQKRRARAALLANVAREAGSGLREEFGDDADALIESYRVKAKRGGQKQTAPDGRKPGPGASKPMKVGRFTVETEG